MKRWEELIRENVFGLGGNRDHLPACLAHMMYCIVAEKQYNLAYFVAKRIEHAWATSKSNLPYGSKRVVIPPWRKRIIEEKGFLRLPDAFCQKYHTYDSVHPEFPGPNQSIRNSPDDSTKGHVIPLAGEDDHDGQNDNIENLNEGSGDADQKNHSEEGDCAGQDEAVTIVVDKEVQAVAANKPEGTKRKRKATEVGVVAAATVPSVTSSMTPTPEREGDGNTYSVSGKNLRTQRPSESPPLMTATVTTTVVAGTLSAPVIGAEAEPVSQVHPSIFADSASIGATGPDVTAFFEFNVGVTRQACLSTEEAEATEGVHLHNQVFVVEDAESARVSELNSLKEQNSSLEEEKNALEGKVTTLESATAAKETELASLTTQTANLTQDLSSLELSCDDLSVKAASLESQRDGFADQVSLLENTCSVLHDQVSSYEIFKEQCEAIQDKQVKCYHSPEYGAAFGAVICLAIDKGIQAGLVAGIDHGKARRDLADIAAYDPSVEARYVSAILAFCDLDFNLLSHLESQKDASIAAIMSLLLLEGPSAETPEVSRLQPSYEQLLFLIYQKEDNVVTGETSLSDSLDVVYARVKKLKESALSHRFSISDAMGVLADPLSSENLIGEASTSGVPVMAATTTALAISVTAANINSIPPIFASVTSYGPSHLGPSFPPDSAWLASLLRLSFKASSFCTMSSSIVLKVGMPISAGITAFVPYVSENGVSPLLDLIMDSVFSLHQAVSLRMLDESEALADTQLFTPILEWVISKLLSVVGYYLSW
ncbi:hypothetical protein Tco_1492161 [Tanacetum coccineum]